MNTKEIIGRSLTRFLLTLALCCSVSKAFAAYQTITNDVWILDNNGNPIMAQGGGISKFGSMYYWYGVQYAEMTPYYQSGAVNTSSSTFVGINCYSSSDLVHWTFQNQVVNTSTSGFHNAGWVGRMGQCVYNSADNQYVIWIEGPGGQCCLTGGTPTGNFTLNHAQGAITNVYTGPGAGDCTIFCDVDHGGTPYFICSDPHGRQHAYVCPLSSNYLTIGDATLIDDTDGIPAWPQGQEASNMFERNGVYYYLMSNLAGWSYSSAYAVWSTNIFVPTDYTADAAYPGTTADFTHYSQVSFGFQVAGTVSTNYIMVGDRWSQFDGTYASAGHGLGFSIMCPIAFTNGAPYFQSVSMFQVDAVTGNIRPATPANTPANMAATPSQGLTPGQVTLSWAASDGATAYNIYRSTTNGGPYASIGSSATANYNDTGLQNGTTYYYVATSTNVFGESAISAQVAATPSIGPLILAISANPNPVFPGQIITFSATVAAQTNPVAAVTLNAGALGGMTNQTLIANGAGNYTNSITVNSSTLDGVQPLVINAVDSLGNVSSPYFFSATVGSAGIIWNGGGSDNNWSDGANWVGGGTPGAGYSLTFDGSTRLTPLMDNSYNAYQLTFDSAAGAFNIGAAGGTLTLSGSVTNASANAQILNVPVALAAPVTVSAATADMNFGQTIDNGGNLLTLTDGGHNLTVSGAISGGGGLSKGGPGTNTIYGVNTFSGNIAITNGTLAIGGAGQLASGAYSGVIADNGALACNSSAAQILSGPISGTGGLNQSGPGPLTLAAVNTLSGPTTITSGGLQISNSLALQDSTLNYNGGSVTFSGITAATLGGLSGGQNLALTNVAAASVALSVGSNGASTTYSGVLSGSGALAKIGTGKLILLGNNTYTGATTVNGGVLQLNSGGAINGASASVGDGAEMIVSGGSVTAGASSNIGGGAATGLLVSAGSATYNGGLTTDLGGDNPDLIEVTGGSLTAASVALGRSGFIQSTLPAAGSTADGLYVNGGTVNITGNLDMSSSGSANSTASARIDSGSLTIGGTVTIGLNNGGRWSVLDVNGGAFTAANTTTGVSIGGPDAGNAELLIRNGVAKAGRIGFGSGTVADIAVLEMTSGSLYVGAGGIVQVSPNVTATNFLAGGILGASTNWSSSMRMILAGTKIQAADASGNPQSISLSGVLSGTNLVKTGGGTLTLNASNTFGGTTLVTAGKLAVNGSLAPGSAVVITNGGTLGGAGVINGPAIIQAGGTLSPGPPTSALSFGSSLTLAPGSTNVFEVSQSPLTNDLVNVSGALTNGGALIVTNAGVTALAAGDVFKLFNAATVSGSFAKTILPALPLGLAWNTNNLNSSGTLSIVITNTPIFGNIPVAGNGLVFQGSGGVANMQFHLLGATNLSTPLANWTRLATNQFDVNGNFDFTNTVITNSQQSFYFLQLQ